jgi:anti-sigma factor RsiW
MDCRHAQSLLETFVDGELSPEQTLSVEAHLDQCAECREQVRFNEAVKLSTKRAVRETEVSESFLARLHEAVLQEAQLLEKKQRGEERYAAFPLVANLNERVRTVSTRALLPVAVAAALFLWLKDTHEPRTPTKATLATSIDGSAGIDQALDRLIDVHSAPPPAQVTNQELLPTLERDVGVRVHAPQLDKFGASWEGANLIAVRNSQAASLRYRMPGRHFTVYVYDPRKVPVHQSLTRRMVHERPVYVGEWRGYTVAAKENAGIGYAMASDLDDVKTAELLTEIH